MALLKKLALAVILTCSPAFAGQISFSNFSGGLDTQDSPASIAPNMAQDMLNVNIQPGGSAIYKRDGYGLFQNLNTSAPTEGIHGGYHFQQTGGSNVQIWASSTTLYGSVGDATFVALASGTLEATWQCTDSQGFAYCFSSSGDTPIKTDGTRTNTSFFSSAPLGTMATFTPLQLVVAGVTASPNTIYISGSLAFNNFTVGILPSSPFQEPIASPGSRITHLAYYFGKLFWWKDQSFGYATFTNQNDWQMTIVSNQIGTLDNSDAFWNSSGFDAGSMFTGTAQANADSSPGGIFFRGQDNHLYVYDGYYLTRLSRVISPSVTASSNRKANSWAQTSQADWQTGSVVPTGNLSTTISAGDVTVSTFGATENSNTQWNSGATSNVTVNPSSITISVNNSGTVTNPDFESSFTGSWVSTVTTSQCNQHTVINGACSMTPQTASNFAACGTLNDVVSAAYFEITDINSNVINQRTLALTADCAWRQVTISDIGDAGKRVKFQFHVTDGNGNQYIGTQSSYLFSGSISFYYSYVSGGVNKFNGVGFDNIQNGSSTISSGNFTSQIYNTGFTKSSATITLSTISGSNNPSIDLQTSTTLGGTFTEVLTSTSTSATVNQYVKYTSTITDGGITSVSIVAASTGSFYSAVNNAPNLTSWNTFVADHQLNSGTIIYFIRSSTNTFSILSSTPAWTAQTNNASVAVSTGTYFQARADFAVTAGTQTPTLNDFTFSWFEGSAADKAYIGYFNDAIWFSVSSGSTTSKNNTIFYWDLLNGAWCKYDIAANGFLVENNALYFGSPSSPAVFLFGGVTSDNNSAINSYWRSGAFLYPTSQYSTNGNGVTLPAVDDIFVQKEFMQADFVLGESSTSLTYTYTLDSKTATAYTITAYDASASLIQRNFLLPAGKIGKYYDFKIGDNSTNAAWRLLAHRVLYNSLNWKPVLN